MRGVAHIFRCNSCLPRSDRRWGARPVRHGLSDPLTNHLLRWQIYYHRIMTTAATLRDLLPPDYDFPCLYITLLRATGSCAVQTKDGIITVEANDIPDVLAGLSDGKFLPQWQEHVRQRMHITLERLDDESNFEGMMMLVHQDRSLFEFFVYHKATTSSYYKWNFDRAATEQERILRHTFKSFRAAATKMTEFVSALFAWHGENSLFYNSIDCKFYRKKFPSTIQLFYLRYFVSIVVCKMMSDQEILDLPPNHPSAKYALIGGVLDGVALIFEEKCVEEIELYGHALDDAAKLAALSRDEDGRFVDTPTPPSVPSKHGKRNRARKLKKAEKRADELWKAKQMLMRDRLTGIVDRKPFSYFSDSFVDHMLANPEEWPTPTCTWYTEGEECNVISSPSVHQVQVGVKGIEITLHFIPYHECVAPQTGAQRVRVAMAVMQRDDSSHGRGRSAREDAPKRCYDALWRDLVHRLYERNRLREKQRWRREEEENKRANAQHKAESEERRRIRAAAADAAERKAADLEKKHMTQPGASGPSKSTKWVQEVPGESDRAKRRGNKEAALERIREHQHQQQERQKRIDEEEAKRQANINIAKQLDLAMSQLRHM